MSYNWPKIFKEKTDKELYDIYSGKTHLGEDAERFAKIELDSRSFDFNNLEVYFKKWTLEKLIEEERTESGIYRLFSFSPNSKHFLLMAIIGMFVFTVMTLDFFFDFMTKTGSFKNPAEQIGYIVFLLALSILSVFLYIRKKKIEDKRKSKIKTLIREI